MKILVTGSGYISNALIDLLLLDDHLIIQAVRDLGKVIFKRKNLRNIELNLKFDSSEKMKSQLDGWFDIVYHIAGEISCEEDMLQVNFDGTKKLAEALAGRVDRWIQLSSVGVYGAGNFNGIVREEYPALPKSIYENSKLKADNFLLNNSFLKFNQICILRPSNVIGEHMKNDSIRELCRVIYQKRYVHIGGDRGIGNYIEISDLVYGLKAIGIAHELKSQIYILSQNLKIIDMVKSMARGMGMSNYKFFSLPEFLVRLIVGLLDLLKISSQLKKSRINALTNRTTFSSEKIIKELNFNFSQKIADQFFKISSVWIVSGQIWKRR